MTDVPWLLVAFAAGTIFGGALTVSMLVVLLTEAPISVDRADKESDWEYE